MEKLVQQQQKKKIRLATWTIVTLTGKNIELIEVMKRRTVSVAVYKKKSGK